MSVANGKERSSGVSEGRNNESCSASVLSADPRNVARIRSAEYQRINPTSDLSIQTTLPLQRFSSSAAHTESERDLCNHRDSPSEKTPLLEGNLRRTATMPGSQRSRGNGSSANNTDVHLLHSDSVTNFPAFTSEYQEALESLPESERDVGERLRRHLQFFFMNTVDKWKVRHQFPFKLALQILKIIFITLQLILFAELRMSHVDFMDDTNTVMRHKFLQDWNDERDTLVYPPSAGRYSVYTGSAIIEQFAFMITAYYKIQDDSFASFSYDTILPHRSEQNISNLGRANVLPFSKIPPLEFHIERIANVKVINNTYEFDISPVNSHYLLNLTSNEVSNVSRDPMLLKDILAKRNITFTSSDALIISKAVLRFKLRTIHFSPVSTDQRPECYRIAVSITFDNSRHTGQVYIYLSTEISYVDLCNGHVLQGGGVPVDTIIMGIIDVLVLFMCLASLMLCCRALVRAHLLKLTTVDYFEVILGKKLSVSDQLEFLNCWYIMILVNDVCIVIGTVCKISIEFRDFDNRMFTWTGILLGSGALLVYVGVLRYFQFFPKYNVLILTMKKSLPNILRFLSCAAVLYAGFLIAGWVIIGPYSLKFRTLGKSSEALFSLLNGDDMFATFFTINDTNTTIKVVGTIYIYIFVSLFIYVVLSLFIAIIMDAYEIVKDRYDHALHVERSALQDFIASAAPPPASRAEARNLFSSKNLLRLGGLENADCFDVYRRFREWCRCRREQQPPYNSFSNPLAPNATPSPLQVNTVPETDSNTQTSHVNDESTVTA